MTKIVGDWKTLLVAIFGTCASIYWGINSNWDTEPIILLVTFISEIIAFSIIAIKHRKSESAVSPPINNNGVNVNVNIATSSFSPEMSETPIPVDSGTDRLTKIDFMKSKTRILFIDDDKEFSVVKILKDSGWKHTKSISDIKSLDMPIVKDANIYFVDINGVGKTLNLENEGLDLALMIKQKYPDKKVVIYSANRTTNAFHQAWDICDKLEKNALPYQFQVIVEHYSLEIYKSLQ